MHKTLRQHTIKQTKSSLSTVSGRDLLGEVAQSELRKISDSIISNDFKTKQKIVIVGAGVKTLTFLWSLKKEMGNSFDPQKFMIIECEDAVGNTYYKKHFRLNTSFFDSLGKSPNTIRNAPYQLSDFANLKK